MTSKPLHELPYDHPLREEARNFEDSVRAIRKAKGLKNPEDCVRGTPEYDDVEEAFLTEMLSYLPPAPGEDKRP
ncbi:hypothetical protein AB4Z48_18260 [Cupriavidus sp. 2TAF22]|uniref:hypothetical protein n=1 Tax=unclassified Cupriavidus TaxID=2640874 RepID=UPI003F92D572